MFKKKGNLGKKQMDGHVEVGIEIFVSQVNVIREQPL